MVELYEHQKAEIAHYHDKARYLAHDPRTGKTRTILEMVPKWATSLDTPLRVLVLLPKSAALAWKAEASDYPYLIVDLTQGTVVQRKAVLAVEPTSDKPRIVLVNYDVVSAMKSWLELWHPNVVVLDEAHYVKSPGAKRTRATQGLCAKARWRRALSGTPMDKDYIDLWAQYKALDPSIFGTNVQKFREQYCIMSPYIRGKIDGYRNIRELLSRVSRIMSRVERESVLEIPKVQEVVRRFELPKGAQDSYDYLRDYGTDTGESHIFAIMMAAQRITAGCDDSHDSKSQLALNDVEENRSKGANTVVWYRFVDEGDRLAEAMPFATRIGGHTSGVERERLVNEFNNGTGQVLLAQQQTLGISVSLASADLAIFCSPSFSYIEHTQARDRIFPKGTSRPMSYIYYVAKDTIDETIYRTLKAKKSLVEGALSPDNLKEVLSGAIY